MSDNIVEITENPNYSITIDTNLVQNNNNVVIELSNGNNIDIINNTTVLVSDLPQGYPLSWTTETLPINRVSGLVGISGINYTDGIISLSGLPLELLPVQNLTAGSGINVINNNGVFSVAVTGQFGLTGEQVDDRVSQLLQAGNNIVLNYDDDFNILNISTSGLQQSGNYSTVGHDHVIADVSGLQNILDHKQPSGVYASGVHYHTHYDISDFNNSVDSRIVAANLQPSGDYSIVGHHHISSDIDDLVSTITGVTPVKSVSGRIGDILLNKNDVGLNNVDNTSDTNKPVSIAQAAADSAVQNAASVDATNKANNAQAYSIQRDNHTGTQLSNTISDFNTSVSGLVDGIYAPLNNPNFSGIPTVPTASSGTNNTQIANTNFVRNEISNLINSAPSTLDTLNELATALGNDPNFSTTITNLLASKAPIANPAFSGTVSGITKDMVGLGNVDNTSDINKPISNSTQVALNNKENNIPSGTISQYYRGDKTWQTLDKISVGLNSVDNTSDNNKPVSIAQALADSAVQNAAASDASTKANNAQAYAIQRTNHTGSQLSNTISDFNTSVSGLLPVKDIIGGTNINISNLGSIYTVSVSGQLGLTGEEVDDRVAGLLSGNNGIVLNYDDPNNTLTISTTGLQPSGNYSLFGHTHTVNDISNFNSSVSGLLQSINGSGYIKSIFNNTNNTYTIYSSGLTTSDITNFSSGINDNLTTTLLPGNFINLTYDSTLDTLTISTSGLQPSGNYSVVGHSHVVSDITNFASGVSGLLPTISNSGNNRLLTSNGTTTGASAQNNLTFNGSLLSVSGSGTFASGININNQISNTIASFDSNKNLTSLSTSTYPSLNELSYLKGVNSALQTQLDNKQPSGNYSIVGHSHTSNSITDFNSTVSGLLPVTNILAGSGLSISSSGGIYSIGSTLGNSPVFSGLTVANFVHSTATDPITGNPLYVLSGPDGGPCMYFNSEDMNLFFGQFKFNIDGSLRFSDSSVQTTAWTGSINTSKINNFNSSVSGLLPVTNILAGSNIGVSSSGSVFTVAVTGQLGLTTEEVDDRVATLLVAGTGIDLTYNDSSNTLVITSVGSSPSGNYVLVGHTHVAANITDFSSAVSGLLPITNILGGSNISVSQSGTNFTVAVTGSLGLTSEEVDDRVANLLVAGSGISLNYDDPNNLLTISTTGLQPSGNYSLVGHNHTSSSITDFNTSVSGLLPVTNIVAGSGISLSSTSGSFTINSNTNIINGSNLYLWSSFR